MFLKNSFISIFGGQFDADDYPDLLILYLQMGVCLELLFFSFDSCSFAFVISDSILLNLKRYESTILSIHVSHFLWWF